MSASSRSAPPRTLGVRLREWTRVALVNVAVLVALLIVVELILGTWLFGTNLGTLNVHTNVQLRVADSPYYPPGTIAHYRRDRFGLRGDYGGDPARITLLAVGGSTTNEQSVGEEDTWSSVLARELRAQGKPQIVANAGVDGHSTAGHLRSFDLWFGRIPGLKPRYMLYFIGINDRGVATDAIAGPDSLAHDTPYRRIRTYVENNSVLIRGVRVMRGWFAARRIGVHHGSGKGETKDSRWVPAKISPDLTTRLRPDLDGYARRLRLLHAKALAFGAMPIYVTQINGDGRMVDGVIQEIEASGGGTTFAELALYNAELLKFCAEVKAKCIDLAGELRFGPGDYYDSVHTTPQGSRKIGAYLAGRILPLLQ
jgi:lysophospholipase L1-like esterase